MPPKQVQNPEPSQKPPLQHSKLQSRKHVTVFPQLSCPVPLQRAPHELPVGVHPQVFGPASARPHLCGATQVSGQSTVCPQLFFFEPQATPAHVVAVGSGVQQVVPLQSAPASAHSAGHCTVCPQLFVTATLPQRSLQAAPSSTQHVPSGLQIAPAAAHAPASPHATV
jgi:hypothetical protein